MSFGLFAVPVGAGQLAVSHIPGRFGEYARDLQTVLDWGPTVVLSMTTEVEMTRRGATSLGLDLAANGITWLHAPIPDLGAPGKDLRAEWPALSARFQGILNAGGNVLIHCHGGCGRSGMMAVRLMIDMGEWAPNALHRLRGARACAVETQAQLDWAFDVDG